MADSIKIIFWPDVYKEQGHWLPTLAWAEYIHNTYGNKFVIEYMGIEDCREIVENYVLDDGTKFKFHPILTNLYPKGYTNEIMTTPGNRWKPEHIWTLAYAGFDKNSSRIKVGAGEASLIYKDACDFNKLWKDTIRKDASKVLVIGGYFTALELLIMHYFCKNDKEAFDLGNDLHFAISTTYLRHPEEDPAIHALQNLQSFNYEQQKKLLNVVVGDKSKDIYDEPDISLEDFVAPIVDFHEFVPCARIFDYSHYSHGPKVHYVEPCITKELGKMDDASASIDWDGPEGILNTYDKIVFVTAGSQILDYKEKALTLFQSIIDAMQSSDMEGYHLILCAGSTLVQELNSDYDNVTVCGWVPQRKILTALATEKHKGSCAIIHGGLATIKECVYCNVPFLVLPLGKDQMDNALRLEDCGIINYFYIEFIKPKCLLYFINQILQDYVSLSNLAALSKEFRDAEDSHIGARAIAHLAENGNLDDFDWDAV